MVTNLAKIHSLPKRETVEAPWRAPLRDLIAERSLVFRDVTLSRGQATGYYFDCKKTTLHPEGASLVADGFLDVIESLGEFPDAIGGLTLGADPIVGAVMMRGLERNLRLETFYVRKEPKKHGTKEYIENAPKKGAKVVIVDDVITTGGSALDAIIRVKDIGCEVIATICLVDRGEGGNEKLSQESPLFIPLFTLEDFPEIQTNK